MNSFELREGVKSILGKGDIEALGSMDKPTVFHIAGEDSSKAVLISTLIHGTEPAGFRAFLREAAKGSTYAHDVYFLVGNVEAAKTPVDGKYFSHRDVPGAPRAGLYDMNRIWDGRNRERLEQTEIGRRLYQTGQELRAYFASLPLLGFFDIHSFMSREIQAHGCIPHTDDETIQLMRVIGQRAFVVDFGLGTLLESMATQTPSVLLESGVNGTPIADACAYEAIQRFFRARGIIPAKEMDPHLCKHWYHKGIQFKVGNDVPIAFRNTRSADAELTLFPHIERLNHKRIYPGTPLGFADSLDVVVTEDPQGRKVEDYFFLNNGILRIKKSVVPNFLNAHEQRMKGGGFYFFEEFTPSL